MSTWIDSQRHNYSDIEVETLLAELLEENAHLDNLLVKVTGGFKRQIRRDIGEVHARGLNPYEIDREIIEVHRNGLYDNLPEGLFHQTGVSKGNRTVAKMKSDVSVNREDESNARRFFWPLDHQFIFTSARISSYEKSSISKIGDKKASSPLMQFWQPPSWLSDVQCSMFMMLIPLFHKIGEKAEWIEKAVEIVTEAKIKLHWETRNVLSEINAQKNLSDMHLGIDSILGATVVEAAKVTRIVVGPLSDSEIAGFIPGNKQRKVLDWILDFMLPCDRERVFDLRSTQAHAELSEEGATSILGYNTVLS